MGYIITPILLIGGLGTLIYFLVDLAIRVPCEVCGEKMGKRKVFCENCGSNLTRQRNFQEQRLFDAKTMIISFFIPFAGLYLWYFLKDLYPHKSTTLAVIGFAGPVIIVLNVFGGLFGYAYY